MTERRPDWHAPDSEWAEYWEQRKRYEDAKSAEWEAKHTVLAPFIRYVLTPVGAVVGLVIGLGTAWIVTAFNLWFWFDIGLWPF